MESKLKFNRLTIIKGSEILCEVPCKTRKKRATFVKAVCECGVVKKYCLTSIKQGRTKSCGCFHKQIITSHGYTNSKTYNSWVSMKARCNDPKYKNYGGRGVKFCKSWRKFENFLKDMGERPEKMTLDRIDFSGNYTPENCRWATIEQQANNKRTCRIVNYNGKKYTLTQLARKLDMVPNTLKYKLNHGYKL